MQSVPLTREGHMSINSLSVKGMTMKQRQVGFPDLSKR